MSGHEDDGGPDGNVGKMSEGQSSAVTPAAPAAKSAESAALPATLEGIAPDFTAPVHTQAAYRLLTMRGLAPTEAANMTAFLVGLHIHGAPWSIAQVNRMLFLKQLYQSPDWGDRERHA